MESLKDAILVALCGFHSNAIFILTDIENVLYKVWSIYRIQEQSKQVLMCILSVGLCVVIYSWT